MVKSTQLVSPMDQWQPTHVMKDISWLEKHRECALVPTLSGVGRSHHVTVCKHLTTFSKNFISSFLCKHMFFFLQWSMWLAFVILPWTSPRERVLRYVWMSSVLQILAMLKSISRFFAVVTFLLVLPVQVRPHGVGLYLLFTSFPIIICVLTITIHLT